MKAQELILRWRRKAIFRSALFLLLTLALLFFMLESLSANQVQSTQIDRELVIQTTLDQVGNAFFVDAVNDVLGTDIGYNSGLNYAERRTFLNANLVNNSRWPRVMMALLVGAALALSGNVMQSVFRNPLADPGLIGVSSGAAIGAIIAILLQLDFSAQSDVILDFFNVTGSIAENFSGRRLAEAFAAFAGGLLMTFLVYRLSLLGNIGTNLSAITNLLLVGLAINAIGGAFIGLATFIGNERRTSDITFWSLGSLKNLEWTEVYIALPVVLISFIILPFYGRQLNVMTLGETEARNLGVNTSRLRRIAVILSAMMIGVSVGFAGIISFVGLVIPHIMRVLFGPDHRYTMPASILGGAIFLIAADMYARTLPPPPNTGVSLEIPVGVLTALIGGPFFLFLILVTQIRRTRV